MQSRLHESSIRRAWHDTGSLLSNRLFDVVAMVVGAVLGVVLLPAGLPPSAATYLNVLLAVLRAIVGVIAVFISILLWTLLRAPYRQRDDAWRNLAAKSRSLPLHNRERLIEAIAEFEAAASSYASVMSFLKLRGPAADVETASPVEQAAYQSALRRFAAATDALKQQMLVAGQEYQPAVDPVLDYVADALRNVSSSNNLLEGMTFTAKLDAIAKKAVQDIDELNQGSQAEHA